MIQLLNIKKKYGDKVVLQDINYNFDKKNCIYTITGKSGSGKTTLFNILFGIDQQFDGTYYLDHRDSKTFSQQDWDLIRNRSISIVYQDFKLLDTLSVYDNLYFSFALKDEDAKKRIHQVLELLHLQNIKNSTIHSISGGEKQRVAIARAILNKPEYILLDEPTSNLDDENTQEILNYLKMLKNTNVTIILITHDHRVENFSDITLHLENGLLTQKENKVPTNKEKDEISTTLHCERYHHLLRYFFKSIKSRMENILVSHIPICVIFCIVIVLYGFLSFSTKEQYAILFQGLSPQAIYISSVQYTDEYRNSMETKKKSFGDDGTRIAFSTQDLKEVENIEHVSKAQLYNTSVVSLYDYQENSLAISLNKNEFNENLKKYPSFSKADTIVFGFQSLSVPSDYILDFNPDSITLKYGNFPKSETNQILLPDVYAVQYFGNEKDHSGEKIKLPVFKSNGEKESKEYVVSGIYQTEYQQVLNKEYIVYVPYDTANLDMTISQDMYIESRQNDIQDNMEIVNYHNPIYDSYETYVQAMGTGNSDMIIRIDDANNQEAVTLKLKEKFPNLKIFSQYEFEKGEFASAYQHIQQVVLVGSVGVALLLGIIITFINRGYIKQRNKEFAIMYSLGYSRKQGVLLIIYEYLMLTIIDLVVAYSILFIAYQVYFKSSSSNLLFAYIFEINILSRVVAFTFLINLVSSIVSLNGIKKKNLKKYLEIS